jgi:hypothetical protein
VAAVLNHSRALPQGNRRASPLSGLQTKRGFSIAIIPLAYTSQSVGHALLDSFKPSCSTRRASRSRLPRIFWRYEDLRRAYFCKPDIAIETRLPGWGERTLPPLIRLRPPSRRSRCLAHRGLRHLLPAALAAKAATPTPWGILLRPRLASAIFDQTLKCGSHSEP